jgi:hypothetical protein
MQASACRLNDSRASSKTSWIVSSLRINSDALSMRCRKSSGDWTSAAYTIFLTLPQRKKSARLRSGDRGGLESGPCPSVQLPGNTFYQDSHMQYD